MRSAAMSEVDEFATKEENMSDYFGIFSAVEKRPVMRDWAGSREEATAKMESLKAEDAKSERGAEDEYYVVRLTKGEAEAYRQAGAFDSN